MLFCARRRNNPATDTSNGVCEERIVHEAGERALHGDEARCATCGRIVALTFGVHGNALVSNDGRLMPDPSDPRNRGIETGDAFRALLRSWGDAADQ